MWTLSHRADPVVVPLADRHYNRQHIGAPQFAPPGSCLVLKLLDGDQVRAFWITSAPYAEYVKHAWAGAWVCSAFRNESPFQASALIRQAVAATCWHYDTPPALGMITFIDRAKVKPTMRRGVKTWGYTYKLAGFVEAGETAGGLLALQLRPDAMPAAAAPLGAQLALEVA